MRNQYPLINRRTGETTGRVTLFDVDSAAGTVDCGDLSAPLRVAVKRGDALSLRTASNVAPDSVDLPEHIAADVIDDVDDLSDLFATDAADAETTLGRIAPSTVAVNVTRPDDVTLTVGDDRPRTYGLVWHNVSEDGVRFRASIAEPYADVNARSWTFVTGATWTPNSVTPGHTDETSGEWVPTTYSALGTLRLRTRMENR